MGPRYPLTETATGLLERFGGWPWVGSRDLISGWRPDLALLWRWFGYVFSVLFDIDVLMKGHAGGQAVAGLGSCMSAL